jgi:porphobilinogen synthase
MIPTANHLHSGYGHDLLRKWQTVDARFDKSTFVYPIFVVDVDGQKNEIKSMPEQYQWSVDRLEELLDPLVAKGLRSVILFGVITEPGRKDEKGVSQQHRFDGLVVMYLQLISNLFGDFSFSPSATWADHPQGPVVRAIKLLRAKYPQLYVICDVCLCQFTSHGHCGILTEACASSNFAFSNTAPSTRR